MLSFLLAGFGEYYDGPVVVLVSELLDQMHKVGVLHLLWSQDVPLVQLLHCPSPKRRCNVVQMFCCSLSYIKSTLCNHWSNPKNGGWGC